MSKINTAKFEAINAQIQENTNPLEDFVSSLLDNQFRSLDDYMMQIDATLTSGDEVPTSVLEDMLMNINSMLYWVGTGLEALTLKESMAKMVKEEAYNKAYNDATGTIGDKKSVASLNSQQEDLIKICYNNAVKLYQYKIDKATEMTGALKKILTRRTAELEISRTVIK